jgi:hypothetical protein
MFFTKRSIFQLTTLLLTAVFIIVVGACLADPMEIVSIDRSALNARIAESENAKTGIEVDTDADNVALGSFWVSQTAMDALENAINNAKQARRSTRQIEIDAAETALDTAIKAFNGAKQAGTKTSGFTLDQ